MDVLFKNLQNEAGSRKAIWDLIYEQYTVPGGKEAMASVLLTVIFLLALSIVFDNKRKSDVRISHSKVNGHSASTSDIRQPSLLDTAAVLTTATSTDIDSGLLRSCISIEKHDSIKESNRRANANNADRMILEQQQSCSLPIEHTLTTHESTSYIADAAADAGAQFGCSTSVHNQEPSGPYSKQSHQSNYLEGNPKYSDDKLVGAENNQTDKKDGYHHNSDEYHNNSDGYHHINGGVCFGPRLVVFSGGTAFNR
jgi:hypothetical protein